LVSGEHASSLVMDAYLLRSLSMAGYSPTLNACVICGVAGTQPFFHVSTGGALCVEHRVPGSVAPRPESFELMQALMSGDWEAADVSLAKDRNEVSGIVAAYVQWHLERGLRSLPLVDRQAT
jgi:DNA repair protein RecO (recombination protein O)